MIRLAQGPAELDATERWALALLVDLSCLLPVDDPMADVTTFRVVNGESGHSSLPAARSSNWGIRSTGGEVTIDRDTLLLVARTASAADEQSSEAADRHGRVPSSENPLVREGLERQPVLHEAAQALRAATIDAAGDRQVRFVAPWPEGRRWAAAVTHDLDVVAAWPAFAALRWLELLRTGHARHAARSMAAAGRAMLGSPVRAGVRDVLAAEARHGVRASWYVLCGAPTVATIRQGDITYRPESPAAREILSAVSAAGHEIGLHGSFATGRDAAAMQAERERLTKLTGRSISGVRQHFLKMRPGETQRVMAAAGFSYDATFGFPDRNGFRLGVADVVPGVPDADGAGPLPIDVVPLVWMDRALSKYQGVEDPEAWIDDALRLAASCRSVQGLWTGLWHPNLTDALGYPGAPRAFARLLDSLAAEDPWFAPLDGVVAWRAARRSTRVATLRADRPPVFQGPVDLRVVIEDAEGRLDEPLTVALRSRAGQGENAAR